MDSRIELAIGLLDAWFEDREEPLEKPEAERIINIIANRYCVNRKSFDEICEALNKRMLGML
jgi:hypothetical protein